MSPVDKEIVSLLFGVDIDSRRGKVELTASILLYLFAIGMVVWMAYTVFHRG